MLTSEDTPSKKTLKDAVLRFYAEVSQPKPRRSSCCELDAHQMSVADLLSLGYSLRDILLAPPESRTSLGCGNPPALAELKPGESVLDIGSGGGLDVFLAARKVGRFGFVVGLDLASAMVQRAKKSTSKTGVSNIEYILSEVEHIPYKDEAFDVVMSNCVINLCPSKEVVFQEIYRVLKPGGRLCVTDVISIGELPTEIRANVQLWAACVAGTVDGDKYLDLIRDAGFSDLSILSKKVFRYGPSDVNRFKKYFQGDTNGFRAALSLEGRLGSIALMANKRLNS